MKLDPRKKKILLYAALVLAAFLVLAALSSGSASAAVLARATDPAGSGNYVDATDELGNCPAGSYVAELHTSDGKLANAGCWVISFDQDGAPVSVDVIYEAAPESVFSYPFEDFVPMDPAAAEANATGTTAIPTETLEATVDAIIATHEEQSQ